MQSTATEVAEQLEAGFPPVADTQDQRLASELFRLLPEGKPVDTAKLAEVVGRPETEVSKVLAGPSFEPLVYNDERGRIIGFSGLGLAELGETVHRLAIDDQALYAWCAADALFLPGALEREVRVASRCPVTGERISLVVSPEGYSDLSPPGAVMSMLNPQEVAARLERGEDVIRGLCHWIFFFASEDAAREWTSEHPGTTTLPVEEGFDLGKRWIAYKWGIGANR